MITLTQEQYDKLVDALRVGIIHFNMKAQGKLVGLDKRDDNVRQALCEAISVLTGEVICGNLQRTGETKKVIEELGTVVKK
jgi:hypothetical protein